jgi:hypothetical protein
VAESARTGPEAMIARIWRGATPIEKADAYLEFLKRQAVPDYRAIRGNQGVCILQRAEGAEARFLILTFWKSRDAIEAFAGPRIDVPKYYPEDTDFLVGFEEKVEHYEVCAASALCARCGRDLPADHVVCPWCDEALAGPPPSPDIDALVRQAKSLMLFSLIYFGIPLPFACQRAARALTLYESRQLDDEWLLRRIQKVRWWSNSLLFVWLMSLAALVISLIVLARN